MKVDPCEHCGDPAGYVPRTCRRPSRIRIGWDVDGVRKVGYVCMKCYLKVGLPARRKNRASNAGSASGGS